MKVLYVQDPEKMASFFLDQSKNRSGSGIIQKGSGGLGNAIGSLRQAVVSTGANIKMMTSSPHTSDVVKVVDPNEKIVSQAKEEIKREETPCVPVSTSIKRRQRMTVSNSVKKHSASKNSGKVQKKKSVCSKSKKKNTKKSALSVLSA